MSKTALLGAVLLLLCLCALEARAEQGTSGGGRGGPYFEYHSSSLREFDPEVSGNPIVIGGTGFGYAAKNFRLGGGGGGGFLWNPSENVHFGMGYGGMVGEYIITSWLSARLLIGGGGYALARVLSETESTRTLQKISSGGFILFKPGLVAEVPIQNWMKMGLVVSYFLPNVQRLHSFTFAINLMFGKI